MAGCVHVHAVAAYVWLLVVLSWLAACMTDVVVYFCACMSDGHSYMLYLVVISLKSVKPISSLQLVSKLLCSPASKVQQYSLFTHCQG